MVKPYLPKGAKTYRIHPRVPVEYQARRRARSTSRGRSAPAICARRSGACPPPCKSSLANGTLCWAERALPCRITLPPAAASSAKAGFHFDNVEHACAFFYERRREVEQVMRAVTKIRGSSEPRSLLARRNHNAAGWHRQPRRSAWELWRRRSGYMCAADTTGLVAVSRSSTSRDVHRPRQGNVLRRRIAMTTRFVGALAHTYLQFLSNRGGR